MSRFNQWLSASLVTFVILVAADGAQPSVATDIPSRAVEAGQFSPISVIVKILENSGKGHWNDQGWKSRTTQNAGGGRKGPDDNRFPSHYKGGSNTEYKSHGAGLVTTTVWKSTPVARTSFRGPQTSHMPSSSLTPTPPPPPSSLSSPVTTMTTTTTSLSTVSLLSLVLSSSSMLSVSTDSAYSAITTPPTLTMSSTENSTITFSSMPTSTTIGTFSNGSESPFIPVLILLSAVLAHFTIH